MESISAISEVIITDIGLSDEESLQNLCFTDNTNCCGYRMGSGTFLTHLWLELKELVAVSTGTEVKV